MRVIIAGGRNYHLTIPDIQWLDGLRTSLPITEVVQGGASGADYDANIWAMQRGIKTAEFRADWKTHGKAAGPMRNAEMARYAECVIAFPGGRGTADMCARAEAHGLKVIKRVL